MKEKIIDFKYLRKFNLIMGGLHFIQGLLMVLFAYTIVADSPFAGFKPKLFKII